MAYTYNVYGPGDVGSIHTKNATDVSTKIPIRITLSKVARNLDVSRNPRLVTKLFSQSIPRRLLDLGYDGFADTLELNGRRVFAVIPFKKTVISKRSST